MSIEEKQIQYEEVEDIEQMIRWIKEEEKDGHIVCAVVKINRTSGYKDLILTMGQDE